MARHRGGADSGPFLKHPGLLSGRLPGGHPLGLPRAFLELCFAAGESLFIYSPAFLLPFTGSELHCSLQVLHTFLPFILHIISPIPLSWLILSCQLLPRVAEIAKMVAWG